MAAVGFRERRRSISQDVCYWRRIVEWRCDLLRCMSLFMAIFGHGAVSDMSPLSAPKRTSAGRSKFMGSRP